MTDLLTLKVKGVSSPFSKVSMQLELFHISSLHKSKLPNVYWDFVTAGARLLGLVCLSFGNVQKQIVLCKAPKLSQIGVKALVSINFQFLL